MVRHKIKPKHLVGYRYYDDQMPKEKQQKGTKPSPKFLKEILKSSLIKSRVTIGYLQCKIIFRKNKPSIVKFYQKPTGTQLYTFNINEAWLSKKKPSHRITDTDNPPYVRHCIIEILYKEFLKSENRLETFLKYYSNREVFKSLANKLRHKF